MVRNVSVTIARSGLEFKLTVYDGCEALALSNACAARAGVGPHEFYLTLTGSPSGAVVPLSASLPSGMGLYLHQVRAEQPESSPQPPESAPAPAARAGMLRVREASAPRVRIAAPESSANRLQTPLLLASTSSSTHTSAPQASLLLTAGVIDAAAPSRQPDASSLPDAPPPMRRQLTMGTASTLEGLERLNRLTTDLANERTLLAWMRTSLAAARTLFAYYGLHAASDAWLPVLISCEMGMATIVVAAAAFGGWRYLKIKEIVTLKIPPAEFGRRSLRPFMAFVILIVATTALGAFCQAWVKP